MKIRLSIKRVWAIAGALFAIAIIMGLSSYKPGAPAGKTSTIPSTLATVGMVFALIYTFYYWIHEGFSQARHPQASDPRVIPISAGAGAVRETSAIPVGAWVCTLCGLTAKPEMAGGCLTEMILWICGLLPGLIYSLWRRNRGRRCPICGGTVVPPLSPMGKRILRDREDP